MIGLLSVIEPATVDEALSDDGWIFSMQEELNQFQRNYVWYLVPKPPQKNIIGTKWVFKIKQNEKGEVTRNKARLPGRESDILGKKKTSNYCYVYNRSIIHFSCKLLYTTTLDANNIPIYCDNTADICLSKNPILHSRAKHIEIKHQFIRDYVQKGIFDIQFIDT